MDKRWLLTGALVLGVFLLVVILVPFFLNADSFRPTIETQLSKTLGRNVNMGKLSFSLLQGSLIADEIVISDDPAFSSVPFMQAKSLEVGVRIIPFLMHREVSITGLTIDTPSIQLIEHTNGKWNYSSLGISDSQTNTSKEQSPVAGFSIGQLKIVGGSALVSTIPQTAKALEYSDVNLTVKQFSFDKSFPFELSAKLPGDGTLNLTGDAGPISQKDTSQTPFHAKLQLREFDPVAVGLIDRNRGISMGNDVDADLTSDGVNASSSGKIKASRLQLAPKGSPAQEPIDIDYTVSRNLASREGTVSDIAIHAGSAVVHVKGTFKAAPEGTILNLRLDAPALPIEQIERLLPILGVRLPSGSTLQGGTLTANLTVNGPATAPTTTGPVEINNTKLAGFDLGSKIEGLTPIGGMGNGTEIRVLKAVLNSSSQGVRFTNIYGEMPQIGTASGDGVVTPTGELDFHLTAKVNNSTAAGSLANQAVNTVGGLVGGLLNPNAKATPIANRGIPLTITGTSSSPSIRANVGAMLR